MVTVCPHRAGCPAVLAQKRMSEKHWQWALDEAA